MHLLHLRGYPIFEQLQLEEALLRADKRNWCLINEGSSPAIVMGISGNVEALVDREKTEKNSIPLIKRFSGGGTVVVDGNTLFVTFICQKELHPFPAYPEPILKWTEALYQPVFDLPGFHLKENDYVIGEKKCGGNAQYIKKERWLHHTSFLWDFEAAHMEYLLHPPKTPHYRQGRAHTEFLCRLRDHLPSREAFIEKFKKELEKRYAINEMSLEHTLDVLQKPHRQATQRVL